MPTILFRSITIAAAASLLAAPMAFAQTAPTKIVYVNSQKILSEAPGRAEAEAQFDKEMGAARAQLQRMEDSLKALAIAYDKEAPTLDSAKREVREQGLRKQNQEFQQRAQTLNQSMQQRQADLARPLMDQVSKVLDEFRTSGNYAMILDVGSPANVIVSADKSLDISDQVLARLKQMGPPKVDLTPGGTPTGTPAEPSKPSAGPAQKPAGATRPRGK